MDPKPEQIGPSGHTFHRERLVGLDPLHKDLGHLDRTTETIGKPGKVVERNRRKRPRAGQTSPEHATRVIHLVEQGSRTRQNRPGYGVEIFVERYVDGIKGACVFGNINSGIATLQEEPRPVEMKSNALLLGKRHHAIQFLLVEHFSELASHGRFYRDHGYGSLHSPAGRSVNRGPHLFKRERTGAWRQWQQRDAAQRLHAIT